MENQSLSKSTNSFGVALAVCSVMNAALVIGKESDKRINDEMQRLTGHHWITHALSVVVVFVVLGFLLNRKNSGAGLRISPSRLIGAVIGGVGAGLVIIIGFYLVAD